MYLLMPWMQDFLNLVEGIINMDNKIRDIMLGSCFKPSLNHLVQSYL